MRAIFNLRASLKLGKTKRSSMKNNEFVTENTRNSTLEAIGYLELRQAYSYMYFKDGISIPFGIFKLINRRIMIEEFQLKRALQ